MANNIEWVHAHHEQPEVVSPELLEELAPDGNEAQDWGVGAGGIMIYGKPSELHAWLTAALADLAEPRRKEGNAAIKALRKATGLGKCEHDWQLTEDGYSRTWRTKMHQDSKVIEASFNGSSDFSEQGEGEYLECLKCGRYKLVPGDWDVSYE
jgi:hypothetical protein